MFGAGVNLLRCAPGRGLQVWGGRTLDADPPVSLYVAHRRLMHRLVRAIRQVAEPLVFDVNGPELWLTLVRAVTSVLLEAFRAGALAGHPPEEAFRVACDDTNNPPGAGSRTGRVRHRRRPGGADGVHPPAADRSAQQSQAGGDRGVSCPRTRCRLPVRDHARPGRRLPAAGRRPTCVPLIAAGAFQRGDRPRRRARGHRLRRRRRQRLRPPAAGAALAGAGSRCGAASSATRGCGPGTRPG